MPSLRALMAALVLASPATAQTYNLFDYWLSPPGVCTASNPNDPGTFNRQYSAGKSCTVPGRGSKPLYLIAKADWASESYVVDSGWLYIINEWHPGLCGGGDQYRVWDVAGTYGMRWAKVSFGTSTTTWSHPAHTLRCGPACGSLTHTIAMGAGEYNEQGILGFIWDQLYDCRSGPCTGPIPMETMVVRGYWGQHTGGGCGTHFDNAEEYWYGRGDITKDGVTNPQPLGLVRFVHTPFDHSTCSFPTPPLTWGGTYLKNCSLTAVCPFC